jgi:3-oxoacyl-(acyl-carrier-protein) synthase
MSEGAGILILENLETAKKRNENVKIYCEILGGAINSDANHITNPSGRYLINYIKKFLSNHISIFIFN